MPSLRKNSGRGLRIPAALLGAALLSYLIYRAGPGRLFRDAKTIGWGMLAILAVTGFAHIVRTWAWRLALRGEAKQVPFSRTLSLRLISEAIGQLGVVGLMFGESARVGLLGSGVPIASAISSVAMDRGLFIAMGAVVTVSGILIAVLAFTLSGALRIYASVFVAVLLGLLALAVLAIQKDWPLFSGVANAVGRVPGFRGWLTGKKAVIESAERQFLQFHRQSPVAFWLSMFLNLGSHLLAVSEVYLILHFLGTHISFICALILESLTKLINVIGAVNPGNLGTYEGGNMVIGKLAGLSGAQGLTLGLCRRVRTMFWAIVGSICFAWYSRSNRLPRTALRAKASPGANPCG